jgi:hypothetical protein
MMKKKSLVFSYTNGFIFIGQTSEEKGGEVENE